MPAAAAILGRHAPEFGPGEWIGSAPLTLTGLGAAGQSVLLHFWTRSSDPSLRSLPRIASWRDRYRHQGLTVVGIHAPEFAFEAGTDTLGAAMARLGVTWPVLNDRRHETWQRFGAAAWPRQILLDPRGRIAHDSLGIPDEQLDDALGALLGQQGAPGLAPLPRSGHAHAPGASCYVASPPQYLGTDRGAFKNEPAHRTAGSQQFRYDTANPEPGIALDGEWQLLPDRLRHGRSCRLGSDSVSFVFSGTGVTLVAGSTTPMPVHAVVSLDGRPVPPRQRGADIVEEHGQTVVRIGEPRQYELVRSSTYLSPAELRLADETGRLDLYRFACRGCFED